MILGILVFAKSLVALGAIGTHLEGAERASGNHRRGHLRAAGWWGGVELLCFLLMGVVFGL